MTALPEDIFIRSDDLKGLRAEYKLQSVKGDVLYPYRAEEAGDGTVVILKDEDDKVRLIAEFNM